MGFGTAPDMGEEEEEEENQTVPRRGFRRVESRREKAGPSRAAEVDGCPRLSFPSLPSLQIQRADPSSFSASLSLSPSTHHHPPLIGQIPSAAVLVLSPLPPNHPTPSSRSSLLSPSLVLKMAADEVKVASSESAAAAPVDKVESNTDAEKTAGEIESSK